MKYSQRVIDEVYRLYPDNVKLQEMAESGDFYLADQLDWERSYYPYTKIMGIIESSGDRALDNITQFVQHEYDICETYRMCSGEFDRIGKEGGVVKFSTAFVDKVKEVFITEDPSYIQMAESNNGFIYRCIDERRWGMPYTELFADLGSEDPLGTITYKCERAKEEAELSNLVKEERYNAMQADTPVGED